MHHRFATCALVGLAACAHTPSTTPGAWRAALAAERPAVPVNTAHAAPAAPPDDSPWVAESLLVGTLDLLSSGVFEGALGTPPTISFNEVRLMGAHEDGGRSGNEAWGLGVEMRALIHGGFFGDLGFWVLEEDEGEEHDVGRLAIGVGYAEALGEQTAVYARTGLEWERGRATSVNFFSFAYDDDTLFGGDDNELGVTGEVGVRHRAAKWLELGGGLRGETLRKDSGGVFAELRLFVAPNVALLATWEDVDEETLQFGLSVVF